MRKLLGSQKGQGPSVYLWWAGHGQQPGCPQLLAHLPLALRQLFLKPHWDVFEDTSSCNCFGLVSMGGLATAGIPAELAEDILELTVVLSPFSPFRGVPAPLQGTS